VQSWNKCVKQLSVVVKVRKLTLYHCKLLFNIHLTASFRVHVNIVSLLTYLLTYISLSLYWARLTGDHRNASGEIAYTAVARRRTARQSPTSLLSFPSHFLSPFPFRFRHGYTFLFRPPSLSRIQYVRNIYGDSKQQTYCPLSLTHKIGN